MGRTAFLASCLVAVLATQCIIAVAVTHGGVARHVVSSLQVGESAGVGAGVPPKDWKPWETNLPENAADDEGFVVHGTIPITTVTTAPAGTNGTDATPSGEAMTDAERALARGPAQPRPDIGNPEQQALMLLFDSLQGDAWARNKKWGEGNDYCTWENIKCDESGSVTELDLSMNRLAGVLPGQAFAQLPNMKKLDMSKNYLRGFIPPQIGDLANLRTLTLHSNHLEGGIPDSILLLGRLQLLDLHLNSLTGAIPDKINDLRDLMYLYLHSNLLDGPIPAGITQLAGLVELDLSSNQFTGSIPADIGNLASLEDLSLNDNKLTGALPSSLQFAKKLVYLRARYNSLSGSIPTLEALTEVSQIDLSHNKLTGAVPALGSRSGGLSQLVLLDLSHNLLTGLLPNSLALQRRLRRLNLGHNDLHGGLPSSLAMLHDVLSLDLSNNGFSGPIPTSLMSHLRHLQELNLAHNRLSGDISPAIRTLAKLQHLNLADNSLTGEIPREVALLPLLSILDLHKNKLEGEIPNAVGSLKYLVQLLLHDNDLRSAANTLPTFLERDLSITSKNTTGHYFCSALKGKEGSVLARVTVDAAYHNYHQCMCEGDFQGTPPDCLPCPVHAHCINGEVICDPQYFSKPGENSCRECLTGAECPGGTRVDAMTGFWRPNVTSYTFYSCPNEFTCLGGSSSTCEEGYEGHLCAICSTGFFSRGIHRCDKCPSEVLLLLYAIAYVVGTTLMVLLILRIKTAFWLTKLKILIGFFQVVACFDSAYDVHWPRAFMEFVWFFSFMTFDFVQVNMLDCPSFMNPVGLRFNYYVSLFLVLVTPMALLCIILLYFLARVSIRYMFPKDPRFDGIWLRRLTFRTKRFSLLVIILTYPVVVSKLFRFFKCRKLENDEWWLKSDYAVECYTTLYKEWIVVCALAMLIYVIIIPAFILVLYLRFRKKFENEEFIKIYCGPLYLDYKPRFFWWECYDVVRKISLTTVVALLMDRAVTQFVVALLLSLTYMLVHLIVRPYRYSTDHWFQFAALLCIHLGFCLGFAVVSEATLSSLYVGTFFLIGMYCALLLAPLHFAFYKRYCAKTYDSQALEEYYGKTVKKKKLYNYTVVQTETPEYPRWVVDEDSLRREMDGWHQSNEADEAEEEPEEGEGEATQVPEGPSANFGQRRESVFLSDDEEA